MIKQLMVSNFDKLKKCVPSAVKLGFWNNNSEKYAKQSEAKKTEKNINIKCQKGQKGSP